MTAGFFDTLFGDTEYNVNLRAIDSSRKLPPVETFVRGSEAILRFAKEHAGTREVYFAVATRNGSGTKAGIKEIIGLHADVDFKLTPREKAFALLASFPIPPTYINETGGGLHLYWLFRESLGFEDIPGVEAANRGLARALGGDLGACDASRILRVPDTPNLKYPHRPVVKILEGHPERRYNLSDFSDFADDPPASRTKPAPPVADRIPEGKRSDTLLSLAGSLRKKGLSQAAIDAAILAENAGKCTPPLEDAEALDLARRYEGQYETKGEAPKQDPKIIVLESMQPRTVEDLILDTSLTAPEDVFDGLMSLGELTVVGGPPKAMKSWTVKTLGLMAAMGAPWLGFHAHRPFQTLLLSSEGREVRLRERFQTLIGFTSVEEEGLRRMSYLSTGGKIKLDTELGERTFLRLIEPYELIILDPWYRFQSEGEENSHKDQRPMQDLFDRVKELGKCIVLVHHVRKPTGLDSGISELRGAGLDGYTDGAIMLSRKKEDADDRFLMRFWLRNFEDPPDMELTRQGVVLVPAEEELRKKAPGGVSAEDILQILSLHKELPAGKLIAQIRELRKVSPASAERAIAISLALKRIAKHDGLRGNYYLPEGAW
jgi:hypothetical protein